MQPDLILIPFGKNATPGTIGPIPKTRSSGDDPQQATWDEGFPQVTMTPLGAGGIPPKGQDFNGVLKAISEHTVFTEHGGQYKWSSDYVTESGGYSIGDVVQADDGLNSYVSLVDSNTANFNTTPGSIGTNWALYAGRASQTQATEATAGVAKIATQPQVTTGADDSTIVTPAKLRAAQATQSEAEAGTDNTKLMTPLRARQLINKSVSGVVGQSRNLKMSVTTASATATLTADEMIVESALGGLRYCLPNFSKNINLATIGAGGMDAGSAPVSGYVAIYAIYNPANDVSALLAANATSTAQPEVYGGANMPAGYTASALISVWPTSASGLLAIGVQVGRRVAFAPKSVLTTSTAAASPTPLSIAAAVPKNANSCSGIVTGYFVATGSGITYVGSDASMSGQQGPSGAGPSGQQMGGSFSDIAIKTAQTIYYSFDGSNVTANYFISDYEF